MSQKSKIEIAKARGTDLLAPFGGSPDDVLELSLSVEKFRNLPTAKAFAKNHGIEVKRSVMNSDGKTISIRTTKELGSGGEWIEVSRGVSVLFAEKSEEPDETEEPEEETETEETETEPVEKRAITKRGDLYIVKALESDEDPESVVRVVGIVAKVLEPDFEGEVISAETIVKANEVFMEDFQTMGLMHKRDVTEKVALIQNVIAPVDFVFPGTEKTIKAGWWYQELKVTDAELTGKIRSGELTGLSLGGFARVVDHGEEGSVAAAQKRAGRVKKAAGDPITGELVDLEVHEVSLVDAAANEEKFVVIKRRKDEEMTTEKKKNDPTATSSEGGAVSASSPAASEPEVKTKTEEETPPAPVEGQAPAVISPEITEQITQAVKAGIESGVSAAVEQLAKKTVEAPAPETVTANPNAEVLDEIKKLGTRIESVEGGLKEVREKSVEAANVRAIAKGESVPDATGTPEVPASEKKSKWQGTAIHSVIGTGRGR